MSPRIPRPNDGQRPEDSERPEDGLLPDRVQSPGGPERDDRLGIAARAEHAGGPEHDDRLRAALSGLPVPDHGPTFWADLSARLSTTTQPTVVPVPTRARGETTVPYPTESATDAGHEPTTDPAPATAPVSLSDRRARRAARRGRTSRSLGAAAAAVALVVAAAGVVTVIRRGDHGSQVRTADRPSGGTARPDGSGHPPAAGRGPAVPAAPAEFSADYDGIDAPLTQPCPIDTCLTWHLTLAPDGSFRWTRTGGSNDMAYDAATGAGRQVEVVSRGAGASTAHPNAFVTAGVPAGGPDMRTPKPDPLGPMADFVVALARASDSRVTSSTLAGRPTWHYDGPTVQDRLGGDGAPNHAVADVDQASGVLLELTRSVDAKVITHFIASHVATAARTDRSQYHLDPPPGAKTSTFSIGFVPKTLDEAAASGLPYDLLVPGLVPSGFELGSVSVDTDVASSTGPEGMNPPAKSVVAMTWRNGAQAFTVTLRPKGADQWDDPLGAEGLMLDAQPVRLPLAGRPELEGTVAVDAPIRPHLWGITGDVVVTVSGDLPRAELEAVAGSLQAHRAG
ncbi:MAG: hypothetical protein QOJ23_3208 [Actinomycetota bacterium]|nr:hypothetical protein [Actinomycetota bacterium]